MKFEIIQIDKTELEKLENIKSEFKIENIEITDDAEYTNTAELLKKVKGKIKDIETFFKEPKSQAHKNHKEISGLEKELKEHLVEFETIAKKAIGKYLLQIEQQNTSTNPISAPKIKGISSSNKWGWRLVDIDKIPSQYLKIEVNEKLISTMIETTNGTINIPGIEIYEEKIVRVVGE